MCTLRSENEGGCESDCDPKTKKRIKKQDGSKTIHDHGEQRREAARLLLRIDLPIFLGSLSISRFAV